MKALKKKTWQQFSSIVTPNGSVSKYDERGVISTSAVSNTVSKDFQKAYLEMFGGK